MYQTNFNNKQGILLKFRSVLDKLNRIKKKIELKIHSFSAFFGVFRGPSLGRCPPDEKRSDHC